MTNRWAAGVSGVGGAGTRLLKIKAASGTTGTGAKIHTITGPPVADKRLFFFIFFGVGRSNLPALLFRSFVISPFFTLKVPSKFQKPALKVGK